MNAAYGLGPGHNRATARTQPNAIPELVKKFKEERAAVLKAKTTFIGMEKLLSLSRATCYHLRLSFETEKPNEGYQPARPYASLSVGQSYKDFYIR